MTYYVSSGTLNPTHSLACKRECTCCILSSAEVAASVEGYECRLWTFACALWFRLPWALSLFASDSTVLCSVCPCLCLLFTVLNLCVHVHVYFGCPWKQRLVWQSTASTEASFHSGPICNPCVHSVCMYGWCAATVVATVCVHGCRSLVAVYIYRAQSDCRFL